MALAFGDALELDLVSGGEAPPLTGALVVPQDVYDIAPEVLRHRVTLTYDALAEGVHPEAVVESILQRVPAPRISPQQMPATEYATQPYAPVAPADPYAAAG